MAAVIIPGAIRHLSACVRDSQLHIGKVTAYREFMELWDMFSPEMREVSHMLVPHGITGVLKAHAGMRDHTPDEARELNALTLSWRWPASSWIALGRLAPH